VNPAEREEVNPAEEREEVNPAVEMEQVNSVEQVEEVNSVEAAEEVISVEVEEVLTFSFVDLTSNEKLAELPMSNKEPIAAVKSELMTLLQQKNDPIPEGEIILYHSQNSNTTNSREPLIDGKLISAYKFNGKNVTLAVEFSQDILQYQKDKTKFNQLNHTIPQMINDYVWSESKKSLKSMLDKNCLNCLAEKHGFSDCKETFFCLSCFHPHKMQKACSCKCVIYHVAQVKDADRFDLKQLAKWNCRRVKRMAEIGRDTGP